MHSGGGGGLPDGVRHGVGEEVRDGQRHRPPDRLRGGLRRRHGNKVRKMFAKIGKDPTDGWMSAYPTLFQGVHISP